MPFTSSLFIAFIVGFLPLFWLIELRSRGIALLFTAFASFAFVAINFPLFALIPVFQAIQIWLFQNAKRSRLMLALNIVLLLLPLLVFKYYDFFMHNLGMRPLHLSLPLGISFYTFTAVGFVVDQYQNKYKIEKPRFLDNLNLLTFWPHLASGPVLRGNDFFFGKDDGNLFNRDIKTALVLIIFGLYKKVVIADGVGGLIDQNLEAGIAGMGPIAAWSTILGFSVRIYGDFSGYSDMAIGFAILMGIYIPANFNYPYAATSLTDFWRRWHISLSTWFRDYVYIPLGGSKHGIVLGSAVVMIVFTVSGLWHGSSWHFVIWGSIHGLILIIERFGRRLKLSLPPMLGWLLTFITVALAWCFFFLGSSDAVKLIGEALKPGGLGGYNTVAIWLYLGLLILDFLLRPYRVSKGKIKATKAGVWLCPIVLTLCFYFAGKPLPFIYFDF
jgi:alginate O-acetyltransferase complex protein AlgI